MGGRLVMTGDPAPLTPRHASTESMGANPPYAALNEQILATRSEDMALSMEGMQRLRAYPDSITPESPAPASSCIRGSAPPSSRNTGTPAGDPAGAQLAPAANSPYLFGAERWRETWIPLFGQVADTRPEELMEQSARWCGSTIAGSPLCSTPAPLARREPGSARRADRGGRHGQHDVPLRPDGWARVEQERPVWSRMSFSAAEENFHSGVRHGLDATEVLAGLADRVVERIKDQVKRGSGRPVAGSVRVPTSA